jgi:hypothetical protein
MPAAVAFVAIMNPAFVIVRRVRNEAWEVALNGALGSVPRMRRIPLAEERG